MPLHADLENFAKVRSVNHTLNLTGSSFKKKKSITVIKIEFTNFSYHSYLITWSSVNGICLFCRWFKAPSERKWTGLNNCSADF